MDINPSSGTSCHLPLKGKAVSYYIAAQLGLDVDQPRNLAKSVTVE